MAVHKREKRRKNEIQFKIEHRENLIPFFIKVDRSAANKFVIVVWISRIFASKDSLRWTKPRIFHLIITIFDVSCACWLPIAKLY